MKWVLTVVMTQADHLDASRVSDELRNALDDSGLLHARIIDVRQEFVAPLPDYAAMAREIKKVMRPDDSEPWKQQGDGGAA